ncbi:hypothetical protein B0H10DRAFT_644746 [Mycena sp. CBHHK59/15]|nr:hypothetical protein B0H10DRAFT_644746 [Mycena sp. CBHHK59/15]
MSAKVYVGNLSWNTTDDTLRNAFADFGQVLDSIVMRDRDTGRSRGFGFVTFQTTEEANAAINNLNEQDLDGRRIKAKVATLEAGTKAGTSLSLAFPSPCFLFIPPSRFHIVKSFTTVLHNSRCLVSFLGHVGNSNPACTST